MEILSDITYIPMKMFEFDSKYFYCQTMTAIGKPIFTSNMGSWSKNETEISRKLALFYWIKSVYFYEIKNEKSHFYINYIEFNGGEKYKKN